PRHVLRADRYLLALFQFRGPGKGAPAGTPGNVTASDREPAKRLPVRPAGGAGPRGPRGLLGRPLRCRRAVLARRVRRQSAAGRGNAAPSGLAGLKRRLAARPLAAAGPAAARAPPTR